MIYLLNILVSVKYFYTTRNIKFTFIKYIPILLLWTLIIGFQYDVGTDYFSYVHIYNSDMLERYFFTNEYLFYYLVKLLRCITEQPQILFIVVAVLSNYIFYLAIKRLIRLNVLQNKNIYVYIFLFLTYNSIFYNQMNGIRNYFAGYCLFLGWTYLIENKYVKFILFALIGALFHRTCLYLTSLIIVHRVFLIKKEKFLYWLMIVALFTSVIAINLPIEKIFFEIVIRFIPMYSHYINTDYGMRSIGAINKISRIIWFPFFLESINLYKVEKNKAILWGVMGYCFTVLSIKITLLSRLCMYSDFWTAFPFYYLVLNYVQNEKYIRLILLVCLIVVFILLKFILLDGEYNYKSYVL